MRGFVQRALKKLQKLDSDQLFGFIQNLAKEHEQLSVVMDSLTEGVMVSDLRHNLIFYNKAAERLLPISPFDVFDHPIWEAILDKDVSEFVKRALERQENVNEAEFALEIGANRRILSISLTPLVQGGKIQGTILIARDVSEKRIREVRLRRAENLASLTTLAAGVAHEIKNPLGSIGIHIQLIQKILARKVVDYPPEISNHLQVLNEEVERLNGIVMDFLFAVRPMDMQMNTQDVNHILEDLLNFMKFEMEEASVKMISNLDPHLPLIPVDERFLKQAFLNILKNALDSMHEGGILTVESKRGEADIKIYIKDTGIGMSKEVQEKIFEPFFTTRDFGSGIGLTLVYKIIKEHGGEIQVHSEQGKGSEFVISLPLPQRERGLLCWGDGCADDVSDIDNS